MGFLDVPTLTGRLAMLEPLHLDHCEELSAAVSEGELYQVWYTRLPSPGGMRQAICDRLAQHQRGELVPWTIRRSSDGRAVGMTTFRGIRPEDRRLEIGSTWLSVSAQGTGINSDCKLLLLRHAFEELECIAVEFRTHWHNHQSRRALEALGAKQDGVLRNHDLWHDGTRRDLVVFSIIDAEWPTVRLALSEKVRVAARRLDASPGAAGGSSGDHRSSAELSRRGA